MVVVQQLEADDLSYNQFAQAFDDVGPDESVWFHPFNRFWCEAVIRNIAENGNCAGMAIESIYADRGQAAFSEPVHDFFPNTQNGAKLECSRESGTPHDGQRDQRQARVPGRR